jgi:hypothetical protein
VALTRKDNGSRLGHAAQFVNSARGMIAKMPAIGGGRRRARVWLLWLDLAIAAHLLWVVALIADHHRTTRRGLGAQSARVNGSGPVNPIVGQRAPTGSELA